jgi:hypothetical protein
MTNPANPSSLIKRLLPAPIIVIGKWRSLAQAKLSANSVDERGEIKYSAAPPTFIEVKPAREILARISGWVSTDIG